MFDYTPKRADYGGSFAWIVWLVVVIALLLIAGFALNWFSAPMRLFSPDRMATLSRQANDSYEALEAQRQNMTAVRAKADAMLDLYGDGEWPQGKRDEYLQLQQQVTNLTMAYNAACAKYKAMWQDEWRSVAAPRDLPTTCSMLE